MAEPFKSTPASRVFGMGLPRRSNLPSATFFGTPIAEERRFLNPKLRQNALAEQELEAKENALAAEQAKRDMELKGQEAMGRAFEELSQGEDIENIFRKNPAIVFSPQFDQLSRATEFVQPSKAVKSLVPNLAKSLPPEFRAEFIAKANNLKNTDEVLGAYTDTELKKSMAEQRGRLGELGVDISQLKPDYLYTPAEEAAFKTKAATAREMAKLDLERKKTSEGALEQARQWALKRGAQANLVNMLDNPSAIYQLGASIGGSRNEAVSRQIIDRKGRLFNIAKDELESAKKDLQDSEFDEQTVIDAKQKKFNAAQENYNQARFDFQNALNEPQVEEELPGMQLPDYDVYSPEYIKAFETVTGVPSAARVPTIPSVSQRGAATAKDITSPAATGGGVSAATPAAPQVQASVPSLDEELSRVPVTEQLKFLERKKAEQVEASKVNEEWTKAKKDLESKLKEKFPDKAYEGTNVKPLEQLALQIVRGDMIRDDDVNAPTNEFGQTAQIPIHEAALRKLNLQRFDKAFTEPGKARKYLSGLFGTQDVTYNELIRDWAKRFSEDRKLINVPLSEKQSIAPEERNTGANLLNKYVPSSNG